MEEACRRVFCTTPKINQRILLLQGGNFKIFSRTLSISNCLRAVKPNKKVPPLISASKKVPKPQLVLDYRPSIRSGIKIPPSPKERPNILRHRTIPIVLGSITLLIFSGYCTWLYVVISRDPAGPVPVEASAQSDVSNRYNSIAKNFDADVDFMEKLMSIKKLRKKIAGLAKGDVLEVSIGTGRNLEYYAFDFKDAGKVTSFTAVDKSEEMLEIAQHKFSKLFPGVLGVRWVVGDATELGKIPPPLKNANERGGDMEGGKYDTIVQTMGLCSVEDPVALLKRLGEVLKEEEGRILLLEHGRGRWKWLNDVLDKTAEGHAKSFGCWWNRDLGKCVEECGLEIVDFKTKHGGTTYWYELKKPMKKEEQIQKPEQ